MIILAEVEQDEAALVQNQTARYGVVDLDTVVASTLLTASGPRDRNQDQVFAKWFRLWLVMTTVMQLADYGSQWDLRSMISRARPGLVQHQNGRWESYSLTSAVRVYE